MNSIAIIGGGASGVVAALEAANNGCKVTIFEKKDKLLKKLLVTGNGRCNFTNKDMSEDFYYCDDPEFIKSVYSKFGHKDLLNYFTGLGLLIKEKNGYFYPASEQASSVYDLLLYALKEHNIEIKTETNVNSIDIKKDKYLLSFDQGASRSFDKVIVSCGGKAGLTKNEEANGYDLLKVLGHKITRLYPSLTRIKCDGKFFKNISGVRSDCTMTVFSGENLIMAQSGEVLFTDEGISGIVTFQLSHCVAELLDKKNSVFINIDLLPGITEEALKNFVISKQLLHGELTLEEFFAGFHNRKLNYEILKRCDADLNAKIKEFDSESLFELVLSYKFFGVNAKEVSGFANAQVTGGGIPTGEVTEYLESRYNKDLFITGELLDVDGLCGGYNLQWAFSTGIIAGRKASLQQR